MTRVVVIGSGFAGLWAALGAARRLDELAVPAGTVDVMVVSNKPFHDIRVRNYEADLSACRIPLGDVLGPAGVAHVTAEVTAIDADGRRVTTPVIEQALLDNGVETRTGVSVAAVSPGGVTLSSGERLAAATVVWCAGMRASRLTEQLPVARDRLGRLQVDDYLRVIGVPAMFAAGDVAAARMDDEHLSVMSCQHGRPMGRYAGCNVINDLFDQPLLALRIPWYVTVLDLGSAGAVYTEGWERKVVSQGAPAKTTKQSINTRRIYPPLNGSRADLLAAAAPRVQPRP